MKQFLKFSICFWISILLSGCSADFYEEPDLSNVARLEAEEFGKQMGDNLRHIVTQMNKNGDDFTDLAGVKAAVAKYSSAKSISTEDIDKSLQRSVQLTPVQLAFLEKISDAQAKSGSTNEFLQRLKGIMEEIQATVPEIQQRNLLKMTAALYHLVKEMDLLQKEGLMPVDLAQAQHIRLRSGSESSSKWAMFWAGAALAINNIGAMLLAELTAAAATVGGYLLIIAGTVALAGVAGVVIAGDTPINWLSSQDCTNKYVHCVNVEKRPSWVCDACRQYCVGQHVWDCPRTHTY
jgi:hypothetical protein